MKLQTHIATGSGGLLLAPFWGMLNGICFFLGSVLPDADHVLDFLWRTKFRNCLNLKYVLKGTHLWDDIYLQGPEKAKILMLFPLHTIEFLILLFLGGQLFPPLLYFFYGDVIHIILDILYTKKHKIPKTWSVVGFVFRKNKFPERNTILQHLLEDLLKELN